MTSSLKHVFLIVGMILLMTQAALAASFTATVDRTSLGAGESLTLDLNVSGADPKETPDLSPLSGAFKVLSQGQTSQTNIVNGQVSTSTGWNIVLAPQKSGALTIPALTIETDQGSLSSEAIAISVGKPQATAKGGREDGLSVDASVSKHDPFQNEPVLLTVKLLSHQNVSDIVLPDFTVDNAIVEPQGKAEGHEAVVEGQRVIVVTAKYLVTPLQPGPLKIPSYAFQGKVESGPHGNPFADQLPGMSDPFGLLQNFGNLPGFLSQSPFDIAGPEISLDVKKPAAQMDPWLPLESLKISDEWDDAQKPRVGEPLTRKITLAAVGGTGAVLPDLESRIDPSGDVRIYADKPDKGQSLRDDGKPTGWRQESFTLIPQKPGKLTLPEIRVPWWDVENNKVSYATLPEKTIDVAPGAVSAEAHVATPAPVPPAPVVVTPTPTVAAVAPTPAVPSFLYAIIAVLAAAVLALAGAVVYLLQRLSRQQTQAAGRRAAVVTANEDRVSLAALKDVKTAEGLRAFLQAYACQQWGLPPNAALRTIARELERRLPSAETGCLSALDAALYAGKSIDIADTRKRCHDLLQAAGKQGDEMGAAPKKTGSLNPS